VREVGFYQLAQAPIAPGSERCARFADGGCVERREPVPLGNDTTFLIDAQLEGSGLHPSIRAEGDGQTFSVDLERDEAGVKAHLKVGLAEQWLRGVAQLSPTTGKRMSFRFAGDGRVAVVDELQPWGSRVRAEIYLQPAEPLDRDWVGVRIGGTSVELPGTSYRGRIANFVIYPRLLPDEKLEKLRASSAPPDRPDLPRFQPGALDPDGLHIVLDDYRRLVSWHNAGTLSRRDLRDASVLAHLWVLDRRPLLQRASDHFGALLSFPDLRRAQTLAARIDEDKPALWWPETEHDSDWVPLTTFRDDLACWLGERDHVVTWGAFVKFVRNKLGGGHFDPDDRQRWQSELNELARKTEVEGEPFLVATMLTLVRSLIMAADGSGFVALARDEVARNASG
jgi:hypothetical protein